MMAGLGQRLPEQNGRRGTFAIERIESYHPFTGERQLLYEKGRSKGGAPTISVTAADVARRAASLSRERLTCAFLTPTRLRHDDRLVRQPEFQPLVLRLLERLKALEDAYGETPDQEAQQYDSPSTRWKELGPLASAVTCVTDQTRWEEVKSYSHRQHRSMYISGVEGRVTFTGNLEPFRELLVWGEVIHVGKSVVKGNGWYRIEG